jgi:multidrug efflux pump
VNIQLPDSASPERTVEVTAAVEKIALETPGVAHTVAVPGTSFVLLANSSNYGNMFVMLQPFHERLRREVPEARVLVFEAPAVRGLGNAGGFKA